MAVGRAAERAYHRILDDVRRGVYAPGTRLPGERALAELLDISRATLRDALERLETESALERSSQRGWFVPRQVVGEPPSTLQSFTEMVRARGLIPTSVLLDRRITPATLEEAAQLAIAPASPVLTIKRLRGMSGTPVCVDTNVLPLPAVEALIEADLTDRSLYERLKTLCGLPVVRSAYTVQAEAADGETAELLQVAEGSPVLHAREVAYTETGVPVLIGANRYRGDAYRFGADLYRPLG